MTTPSTTPIPHDKARAAARKAFLRRLKIAADFEPFDDALSAALTAAEPYIRAMVVEECAKAINDILDDNPPAEPSDSRSFRQQVLCVRSVLRNALVSISALAPRTASEGN